MGYSAGQIWKLGIADSVAFTSDLLHDPSRLLHLLQQQRLLSRLYFIAMALFSRNARLLRNQRLCLQMQQVSESFNTEVLPRSKTYVEDEIT